MSNFGSLQTRKEPSDGGKFFSQPPFRSVRFVMVTIVCVVCVILVILILYRTWLGRSRTGVVMIALIGYTIAGIWWRAVRYINRLRQLYREVSITQVEAGSTLDVALGVAAGITNDLLFFSFCTMALLLVFVYTLATRAGR